MSWIKIRTNLATDPAVAAIGIRTNMHSRQVVGCLVAVWCWADTLTADGFIPHATPKLIDEISGKRGFAEAMSAVGWLHVEAGGVRFPNWDRHHSQSAKARAGESERKRLARSGDLSAPPAAKMSGQMSGQTTEQSPDQSRGEEIREDKTVGRADSSAPAPAKVAKQPRPADSDAEWMASIAADAAYAHVNIPAEHAKMVRWCDVNRKQPSRKRFINWINRVERPMTSHFSQPVRVQT